MIPALDTLIQSRSQLWGRLDALQLKIWLQSTWPPLQQLRPRQTVIIDFQHFQFEIVWYLRKMAVHFTENRLHKSDYIKQHLKFQPSTSRCRRRPYTTRQTLSNCAGRFPGLATNSLFISVFFFFVRNSLIYQWLPYQRGHYALPLLSACSDPWAWRAFWGDKAPVKDPQSRTLEPQSLSQVCCSMRGGPRTSVVFSTFGP